MALIQIVVIVALAISAMATPAMAQETLPSTSIVPPPPSAEVNKSNETLAERIARQDKEKQAEKPATPTSTEKASDKKLTPEEAQELVRLRAEEIRLKRENERLMRELAKQDDAEMRQARKELQREADRKARNDRANREALDNAALEGCSPDSVEIRSTGPVRNIFNIYPVGLRVRLVNAGKSPISVETSFRGYGSIVKGLCSGGSITLSVDLRWEDSQMVQVPFLVRAVLPNGNIAVMERRFYLSKWQGNYQRVDNQTWVVNLDNR